MDDRFWLELIPEALARERGISIKDAVEYVVREYESIGENDIRWYIPEYWFKRFNLKVSVGELLNRLDYGSALYDDIQLLNRLEYKVIIATCNPEVIARMKIDALSKIIHVYRVFSSISYGMMKNKEFYMRICNDLNLDASDILHIGDNIIQDFIIPRGIGMQALLMDRDYRLDDDYVIHSLSELINILMQ